MKKTLIRKYMKEIIACSGSHGFIGSHLAERFKELYRLDRTGILKERFDVIYDLAALGNLQLGGSITKNAKPIYQANLMRVLEEIDHLQDTRQKFVYISTSSVLLPVQTVYSLSKKATEDYLKYVSTLGLQIAIVRPFTIIGLRQPQEHLIPKLIDSCLNGTKMPFVSKPVHDYLDVDDFVDALLIIKDYAEFKGEIYEVGSGYQLTNENIKDIVEEITGREANLKYVNSLRSYDTDRWIADTKKIKSLGWKPRKGIKQTIAEMVYERTKG